MLVLQQEELPQAHHRRPCSLLASYFFSPFQIPFCRRGAGNHHHVNMWSPSLALAQLQSIFEKGPPSSETRVRLGKVASLRTVGVSQLSLDQKGFLVAFEKSKHLCWIHWVWIPVGLWSRAVGEAQGHWGLGDADELSVSCGAWEGETHEPEILRQRYLV